MLRFLITSIKLTRNQIYFNIYIIMIIYYMYMYLYQDMILISLD